MFKVEELEKIRDLTICQLKEVKDKLVEAEDHCYSPDCSCITDYKKEIELLEEIYKRTVMHIADLRNRQNNMR